MYPLIEVRDVYYIMEIFCSFLVFMPIEKRYFLSATNVEKNKQTNHWGYV